MDVEGLLRGLELELLRPELRESAGRLANLLADDFREFGSSGRIFLMRGRRSNAFSSNESAYLVTI